MAVSALLLYLMGTGWAWGHYSFQHAADEREAQALCTVTRIGPNGEARFFASVFWPVYAGVVLGARLR